LKSTDLQQKRSQRTITVQNFDKTHRYATKQTVALPRFQA
jgi:hypothetical protein